MKTILLLTLLSFLPQMLQAQAPAIEWARCYGGSDFDVAQSAVQTSDGGYIIAGSTASADGDVTSIHGLIHGLPDAWVIKIDPKGNIQWQKTYGGGGSESASSIIQTSDHGYIFTGYTDSASGDVVGFHSTHNYTDAWVVKLDSDGNILWQKCLGGSGSDGADNIIQTFDGGYIIAAGSASIDGDVSGFHGGLFDSWIVKLDSLGKIEWQKCFGGESSDGLGSIIQTSDSGYILAGQTHSTHGEFSSDHGVNGDAWILKITSKGDFQWQQFIGGSDKDWASSIQQTIDGGYIFAGITASPDGDITGLQNLESGSVLIGKLNTLGEKEWIQVYGGSSEDQAYSLIKTSDGGYAFAGYTFSNEGFVSGNHGASDMWVAKFLGTLEQVGTLRWQKTLGGHEDDRALSMIQTSDGGYLVVGSSASTNGDVSSNHGGVSDAWVVKLAPEKASVTHSLENNGSISLSPNPTNSIENISYSLVNSSLVKIELYNPLGEKLRTLLDTKEEAGNHEHEFDLSGMASGSYFLRIDMNGHTSIRLFEVVK
jgi:hypothetical protein